MAPSNNVERGGTDGREGEKACCRVKKSTIAIALFGIGIVAAVIVWGVIRSANSSSSSVANRTMSTSVQLHPSSVLHIWFKTRTPEQNRPAHIQLRNPEGHEFTLAQTHQHKEFEFHEVAPRMDGPAQLQWITGDTWVSYIYVYEPESVLELGIRPAFIANAARNPDVPEGYHFRPPLGWMNDPNGFSKLGPHYHLFYQHYPHSLKWSSMHWGHAVSRDLLNWVHQPLFLLPDPSVALDHDGQGGIFSGSAIPHGSALRVYYTDSLGPRSPKEFQRIVTSLDGVHPEGPAQTIIQEGPSNLNLTQDFRDPNVIFGPDGKWKMLLGSKDANGGVILLYGTDDPRGVRNWQFLSVLHRDSRMNMTVAECSGIVPIDGDPRNPNTLWALIYAQMDSTDPRTGRRDLSKAIVGNFDGIRFQPLFEQELDFGTHAYAFQAFYGQDGTLAIAWLASWKFWDWKTKPDFPTAMTLPRRFVMSPDRKALLTPPLEFVIAKLRDYQLDDGTRLRAGQFVPLPNGTAEVRFSIGSNDVSGQQQQQLSTLPSTATIRLEIAHPKLSPLAVEMSPEGLEILPGIVTDPVQRLIAMGARPREVQVLLDTGSIEVFADGGRWAGSLRVPGVDKFTGVQLSGNINLVSRSEVLAMRPAAFRGKLQQPIPT